MPKAGLKYTKGTVVQVFAMDKQGFPTNHVERDTDGQHWHVVGDKDPVAVDADELQSIGAETSQTKQHDTDEK